MKKRIIGVTGGIGNGKSAVARLLAEEYEAYVIDADKLGHAVLEEEGRDVVAAAFGDGIVGGDGHIMRGRLAREVFADPDKLRRLSAITQPLIMKRAARMILERDGLVVLEAALLIEAGWQTLVDEVWVVACEREIRIRRIMERDGRGEKDAKRRIESQMSDEDRIRFADVVIDNSGSLDELKKTVKKVMMGGRH